MLHDATTVFVAFIWGAIVFAVAKGVIDAFGLTSARTRKPGWRAPRLGRRGR
jgi:hypothetical protein